jgi:hypothetical protein
MNLIIKTENVIKRVFQTLKRVKIKLFSYTGYIYGFIYVCKALYTGLFRYRGNSNNGVTSTLQEQLSRGAAKRLGTRQLVEYLCCSRHILPSFAHLRKDRRTTKYGI